jgi:hypothetical protein
MSLHAAGRVDEGKMFADDALRDVVPVAEEAAVRLASRACGWFPDVRVHASRQALKLPSRPRSARGAHEVAYNLWPQGGR